MRRKKEKRKKAVALKYEMDEAPAPQVVARGSGEIAKKILSIAEASDVPVVEDLDLLNLLLPLQPGEYIPEELYMPVAKLLAYITYFHQQQNETSTMKNSQSETF